MEKYFSINIIMDIMILQGFLLLVSHFHFSNFAFDSIPLIVLLI